MKSRASIARLLFEQIRLRKYGDAARTRNDLADLTGIHVIDRGPSLGLEAYRDELPPGVVELAGIHLDDAMGRIGRRVMRAEFGDGGRPADSPYGRLPGALVKSSLNEKPPTGPGKPAGGLIRSAAGRTADRACSRVPEWEAPTYGDRTS